MDDVLRKLFTLMGIFAAQTSLIFLIVLVPKFWLPFFIMWSILALLFWLVYFDYLRFR